MSPKKRFSALTAASVVAAGVAIATSGVAAGANERRDFMVCNWTDSSLAVDPDGGQFHQIRALQHSGCVSAISLPVGVRVTLRLADRSGRIHETTWWQPGQHMRIDITGPVEALTYTPTYW